MNKNVFSVQIKLAISVLIVLGCVLLGFGIGLLSNNSISGSIIGAGFGFLLIALILLIIELNKMDNN